MKLDTLLINALVLCCFSLAERQKIRGVSSIDNQSNDDESESTELAEERIKILPPVSFDYSEEIPPQYLRDASEDQLFKMLQESDIQPKYDDVNSDTDDVDTGRRMTVLVPSGNPDYGLEDEQSADNEVLRALHDVSTYGREQSEESPRDNINIAPVPDMSPYQRTQEEKKDTEMQDKPHVAEAWNHIRRVDNIWGEDTFQSLVSQVVNQNASRTKRVSNQQSPTSVAESTVNKVRPPRTIELVIPVMDSTFRSNPRSNSSVIRLLKNVAMNQNLRGTRSIRNMQSNDQQPEMSAHPATVYIRPLMIRTSNPQPLMTPYQKILRSDRNPTQNNPLPPRNLYQPRNSPSPYSSISGIPIRTIHEFLRMNQDLNRPTTGLLRPNQGAYQ